MDKPQVNGEPEHNEAPHTPVMESVKRFAHIPVVEKTLHAATDVYEKVKEVSPALNWTLSTAESTVNKAVESAMPLTAKLEKPLKTVDSLLCSSLDYVESKVPVVKLPPQEILDTTKHIVQEKAAATKTIVQEKAVATKHILQEKAEAVKEYGERRLSFVRGMSLDRQGAALLAQNCKELASSGMEMAKDVAHRLMTPKEREEEIEEESKKKAAQSSQNPNSGEASAVAPAMQYDGNNEQSQAPYVMRY